jgi:putative transcriptional regulator
MTHEFMDPPPPGKRKEIMRAYGQAPGRASGNVEEIHRKTEVNHVLTVQLKNAYKMITQVSVDRRRRVLLVQFADGLRGEVPLKPLKEYHQLDLERVELPDPYVIRIGVVGDAEPAGIPWDFARYYCDPAYAQRVDNQTRADRQILGHRLRELRAQQGWAQEELSQRSGVSRITINRLENAHEQSPRLETVEKLAAALRVELAELFASGK